MSLADDSHFIKCECEGEILAIETYGDDEDEWDIVSIVIYRSWGHSWWLRLKFAWKYLRYGEYYGNDMTIKKTEIPKIIEFLQSIKPGKKEG